MNGFEEKIRQRAYDLWEQSGKTEGSEMDFCCKPSGKNVRGSRPSRHKTGSNK